VITLQSGSNPKLVDRTMSYDAAGNVASIADATQVPTETISYSYDRLGQIQDQSIGLYWYGSRAYGPALGKFCQPDTVVPSPGDPQSLNRYGYVRNNPVGRVDPTGHWDLSNYAGRQAARDFYNGRGVPVVVG